MFISGGGNEDMNEQEGLRGQDHRTYVCLFICLLFFEVCSSYAIGRGSPRWDHLLPYSQQGQREGCWSCVHCFGEEEEEFGE